MREQARQWLANLAAALAPWQLVVVSGNDLFAAAMVWSYPGPMRRAASLEDLQALIAPPAQAHASSPGPGPDPGPAESASEGTPSAEGPPAVPISRRPLPQQILPIRSDPPGAAASQEDCLFFLLCDDLPDGTVDDALAMLDRWVPPERRRLLCVLADGSDRQRLRRHLAAGVQGLCTLRSEGKGRIYTAVAVIASGGSYLDPLFHQRLHQGDRSRPWLIGPEDLEPRVLLLLRDVCEGYNSLEIAARHGLAHHSVRRHLSDAYRRIGVRDRAQAIGWCVAQGMISPLDLQRIYLSQAPRHPAHGAAASGRG